MSKIKSVVIDCPCYGDDPECPKCAGAGRFYDPEYLNNTRIREEIGVMVENMRNRFSPEANRSLSDLPSLSKRKRKDY